MKIRVEWNKYEHQFTGMLMMMGDADKIPFKVLQPNFNELYIKKRLNIFDNTQADAFKELFLKDGALIVHPATGDVSAVTCKLYPGAGCQHQHKHKGTKHNSTLEVTWDVPCIAVVRSDSGGVTIYSSPMTHKGFCMHADDCRG